MRSNNNQSDNVARADMLVDRPERGCDEARRVVNIRSGEHIAGIVLEMTMADDSPQRYSNSRDVDSRKCEPTITRNGGGSLPGETTGSLRRDEAAMTTLAVGHDNDSSGVECVTTEVVVVHDSVAPSINRAARGRALPAAAQPTDNSLKVKAPDKCETNAAVVASNDGGSVTLVGQLSSKRPTPPTSPIDDPRDPRTQVGDSSSRILVGGKGEDSQPWITANARRGAGTPLATNSLPSNVGGLANRRTRRAAQTLPSYAWQLTAVSDKWGWELPAGELRSATIDAQPKASRRVFRSRDEKSMEEF